MKYIISMDCYFEQAMYPESRSGINKRMEAKVFFVLLFFLNFSLRAFELSQKAQTQLILMRVINNTSQSYRLSAIEIKEACKPEDDAYCPIHQKIRPITIIAAHSQKLPESLIRLAFEMQSPAGSSHLGKLLLENLMKPNEYIVIRVEQLCSYIKREARFSCTLLKPNKDEIKTDNESLTLKKNYNFKVYMDLQIDSAMLTSATLSFTCQTD